MDGQTFDALLALIWGGHGRQARAAAHWGVADRTMRRFVSGASPIPKALQDEAIELAGFAPPPVGSSAEDDRDEAARAALAPHIAILAAKAARVGWHPAEIAAALLSGAIDMIRDSAGEEATKAALRSAGYLGE